MESYSKGVVLGRGTFGEVIKATHNETGQVVAIKKIRIGEKGEGVNVTALREVKFLRELQSPHIVRLLDVFPQKRGISLVFEYMESDLEHVIKDRSRVLSAADVKAYMQMVLRALAACHARWVVHRDVKPNNFLVAASGELKLGDFGLARLYGSPERKYTNQVFARWYRPPELFYGSTCYGPSVDIWAAGCVFAELMLRRPWFPGESDTDVLAKIFMALGTPTDESWGGLRHMPAFVEFTATPAPGLKSIFRGASDDALDLLGRMMAFDASRRISAADALQHRFFRVDPQPTPPHCLPRPAAAAAAAAAAQPKQQQQQQQPAAAAVVAAGAVGASQQQPAAAAGAAQQQQQAPVPALPQRVQQLQEAHPPAAPLTDMPPPPNRPPRDSMDPGQPTGMSTVVKKISLNTGGAVKRLKTADGSGAPSGGGGGGGARPDNVTPMDDLMATAPPESSPGHAALRPKLDSGDITFLRKRKMQLDEAFEEAGQPGEGNGNDS